MTTYLIIDTAAGISIGIAREQIGTIEVLAHMVSPDPRHHAEHLAPMVRDALEQAGINAPDVVIAGTGPAAFTGLRAGLVTARTLAAVWGVPIYGLSSLEALALAGMDKGVNIAVPIIDARRKEVYALRGRAMGADDIELLDSAQVIKPAQLAGQIKHDPAVVVKHEADKDLYADVFDEQVTVTLTPSVWVRLLLSRQARIEAGESGSSVTLSTEPQYLRRPDVHSGAHAQPAAQGNPYAQ